MALVRPISLLNFFLSPPPHLQPRRTNLYYIKRLPCTSYRFRSMNRRLPFLGRANVTDSPVFLLTFFGRLFIRSFMAEQSFYQGRGEKNNPFEYIKILKGEMGYEKCRGPSMSYITSHLNALGGIFISERYIYEHPVLVLGVSFKLKRNP